MQRHCEILGSTSELFELKCDDKTGLGVFAKKTIKTNDDLRSLDGECVDKSMSQSNWSRVRVDVGNKKEELLLVGPINFVNHGCDECANCVITDVNNANVEPYCVMELREYKNGNKKKIRKGKELLCDYGEKFDNIKCACGK